MSTNEFCFVCLFVFFAIALKVPFKVLNGLLKKQNEAPPEERVFFVDGKCKICQVSANEIKGERRISWKQSKFEFEI